MPRRFASAGLLVVGALLALTVSSCGRQLDNQTRALLEQLRSNKKAPIADALEKEIERALADLKMFKLDGHVIVGQVVVEGGKDARMVQPQMLLQEEGYFVGAVKQPGMPVGFRLHGYSPVDVIPMGQPGTVEHVGIVQLTSVPKQELAKLKGKVEIENREGRPDLKSVRLAVSIDTGPINTPSGGTQGVTKHAPPPVSPELAQDGEFTADGFSPAKYVLHVSAPGCVEQFHRLTFTRGETLTLEPILLEVARNIKIEYAVSDKGDFAGAMPQAKTLASGERWKAGQKQEQYGWDLLFEQKAGKVQFNYSYGPCEIADLGEGTFAAFRQPNPALQKFRDPQVVPLKSGHVYLLNQQAWKHWVLFRVVVEP